MGSKWPALKRTVPTYPPLYVSIARVVPTFFIMGACIELFMQKVPIGGRTFYDVALDKEVCTLCSQQLFSSVPDAECISQAERRYLAEKEDQAAAEKAAARLQRNSS